jgi:hypothetical protein
MSNHGLSKHQKDKERLKKIKESYFPPDPMRRRAAVLKPKTAEQVYADPFIWKRK